MKVKPESVTQADWDAVDIPGLTDEQLSSMLPANQLPELCFLVENRKNGRPAGSGKKRSTTIRLDNDVLEAFRATGRGWQTRVNNVLLEWLKEHGATP
jgi:uncharacterized protein (DUF4415 family)